jgi:hypothetical protein
MMSFVLAGSDCLAGGLCVTDCLATGGHLTSPQRLRLATAIDALQQRIQADLGHDDQAAYFRAWDLLQVARHVQTAADAP